MLPAEQEHRSRDARTLDPTEGKNSPHEPAGMCACDRPCQHGAASGDCSATSRATANILWYSVSSFSTHAHSIVLGKASLRMLLQSNVLRIRTLTLHCQGSLDRTVVLASIEWIYHGVQAGGYDSRSVCRKARSRAICDSRPGTNIAACSSCMYQRITVHMMLNMTALSWHFGLLLRALRSASEDVRTVLRLPALGTH